MTRLEDRDSAIAAALQESGSLVAVAALPGRNRGLVATEHINAGTTVLLEEPVAFASLPGHADLELRCALCLTSKLVVPAATSTTKTGGGTYTSLQEPLLPSSTSVYHPASDSCSTTALLKCCCGLQNKSLPQRSPLAEEFLAWAHTHCPTMALGGSLALQAVAAELDAGTLLSQYDHAPWTKIAPNPFPSGPDDIHEGEDNEDDEGASIDHVAMAAKEDTAFRQNCRVLCLQAYEMLGLEKASITLDEWDRLIGIVEKNAVFILPKSPFRDALETNINTAVIGCCPKLDIDAFHEYTAGVEKHAKQWCSVWGEECVEEEEEEEEESYGDEEVEEDEDEEEERDRDGDDDLLISPDNPLLVPLTALVRIFNHLPPPEYSGLFPALALMNHSCSPNVEIQYNHGDYRSSTVAIRDILPGEEVCHSYVSLEELPGLEQRQARLLGQHGFLCRCSWCDEQGKEEKGEDLKKAETEEDEENKEDRSSRIGSAAHKHTIVKRKETTGPMQVEGAKKRNRNCK